MGARSAATALALIFTLASTAAIADEATTDRQAFNRIDEDNDGVINADEVRASSETWFLVYDADGDGMVSSEELAASDSTVNAGRVQLSDLDRDGDGEISREEFVGAERGYYDEVAPSENITTRDYGERVAEREDRLVPDMDGDGIVSEDEAAADWERSFLSSDRNRDDRIADDEWTGDVEGGLVYDDLDTDGDGSVSRQEYLAYGQQSYTDTRTSLGTDDVATRDYAESTRERDDALVPSADLDGDGIISRAEAEQDAERRFIAIDRDQNSFLSAPEFYGDVSLQDMVGISEGEPFTRDDMVSYREREFEEADLDGDGTVTVWEYRSYRRN